MANKSQNLILSALIGSIMPFSQVTVSQATPGSVTPTPEVKQAEYTPSPTPVLEDVLIWVVKDSETAQSIAASYYGSESYWTTLWNDNEWIVDPKALPEGSSVSLRKATQVSPEELKPSLSLKLQDPKNLSEGERYVYLMTHARSYAHMDWSMPILKYKYMSTRFSHGHPGIDLSTYQGTPVYAASDGTIIEAGWSSIGYGKNILIAHTNGMVTRYAHLSSLKVHRGQNVTRGAEIGGAGCTGRCTGTHLHFEVHQNGHPINPLNVIQLW